MAGYGLAVQQGVQLATVAFGGDTPQTIAAYNATYNTHMQRYQQMDRRVAAERNIASIEKDKILTNATIQLEQNATEANIRANAAWIGAEGGSVEAVVYDTEAAQARRQADADKEARNRTEGQLNEVGSASSALSAVQEPQQASLLGSVLGAFSQFDANDLETLGTQLRGKPDTPTGSNVELE